MVNINLKKIEIMIKLQNFKFLALAVVVVFFLASFDKSKKKDNLPTPALTYQHYRIIWGSHTYELESSINYYLKEGWIPIGGVVIDGENLYQAIAK